MDGTYLNEISLIDYQNDSLTIEASPRVASKHRNSESGSPKNASINITSRFKD